MTFSEWVIIALFVLNCLFIAVSLVVAGNLISHMVFG